MATQIRVRRDTLANWTGVVPANGEPIGIIGADGLVTTYKIGDGVTAADQLPALSKGDRGDKGNQGRDGANVLPTDQAISEALAARRVNYDIRDFGAVSGAADVTAAVQAAVNAAGNSGEVLIPSGTWNLATTVATLSGTRINIMAGADVIVTATNGTAFAQSGSVDATPVAVTAGATRDSMQLTVADASKLSVNGWVFLFSDDTVPTAGKLAFLRRVAAMAGNVVTIDKKLPTDLTSNPQVTVASLLEGHQIVGGGRIRQADLVNSKGPIIQSILSRSPVVEGVWVGPGGGQGVHVSHVVGGHSSANIRDLVDDVSTGHFGYGHNVAGATRDYIVNGGSAKRARHGFTTNTGSGPDVTNVRGVPEDVTVTADFVVTDMSNAGIDTHEQGYNIIIFPNVRGCAIGVQTRSNRTVVGPGMITGATLYGIHFGDTSNGGVVAGATVLGTSGQQGAAALRVRGPGVVFMDGVLADVGSGASAVVADVDWERRGGLITGSVSGAGAQKLGLFGRDAFVPSATAEIKQALINAGLLATGTADLDLKGGNLTSTATVTGRTVRANATGTTDTANRTDTPAGFTGVFDQYRVNGVPFYETTPGRMFVRNSNAVPTDTPSSGGYLYVESGALKWKGSSGTVTTIGPA